MTDKDDIWDKVEDNSIEIHREHDNIYNSTTNYTTNNYTTNNKTTNKNTYNYYNGTVVQENKIPKKKLLLILIFGILGMVIIGCIIGAVVVANSNSTPTYDLSIKTSPSGASVYLNDVFKGTSTVTLKSVPKGVYTLKITKDGYTDYSTLLSVDDDHKSVSTITLKKNTGSLKITSNPKSATIYIDDVKKGTTPVSISDLSIGNHVIRASKDGYTDKTEYITIEGGENKEFNFDLVSTTGSLSVSSYPSEASVYIDDVKKGITPLSLSGFLPGEYNIKLTLDGYIEQVGTVSVKAGDTTKVSYKLLKVGTAVMPDENTGNQTTPNTDTGKESGGTTDQETKEETKVTTGTLVVTTVPYGASVYVDDKLIGTTPTSPMGPLSISGVTEGTHKITIKNNNYNDISDTVTVTAGGYTTKTYNMVVVDCPVITTNEELKLFYEGNFRDKASLSPGVSLGYGKVTASQPLTLDINGGSLSGIRICSGSSLTISDSIGTGKISGIHDQHNYIKDSSGYRGGCVYIEKDASFTLNGGSITGNKMYEFGTDSVVGGGVYNLGTFTMNGGYITGNNVAGGLYGAGGGVYNGGTFILNDGVISGNSASSLKSGGNERGGGIYHGGYSIEINGGIIKNNSPVPDAKYYNGSTKEYVY